MRKKASWVLVIGIWWKGELSPSIFIFTSSFLMIFFECYLFGRSYALALTFQMPLDLDHFVRVWEVTVD
jgi:hypothetical protein